VQRYRLVPDLTDEKHRRARRIAYGKSQLVLGECGFDRCSHFLSQTKEAVGWRHSINPLMGAEVIVMRDEVPKPLARVF
jgi:hypothetical protein